MNPPRRSLGRRIDREYQELYRRLRRADVLAEGVYRNRLQRSYNQQLEAIAIIEEIEEYVSVQ